MKVLYLNGSSGLEYTSLMLWEAPEPRISFSSFSYKNHWAAYVILNISMNLTLIYSIINKPNILILRNNTFYFLFLIYLISSISVFCSGSNSGIILLTLYSLFCMFIFFNKTILNNKIISLLFFSFLPVILLYLNPDVLQRVCDLLKGNSFRFHLWNDLLHQIHCKTFWGYGVDSYKTINGIYQSDEITSARLQNLAGAHQLYIPLTLHGHSDFLQTTSEIGFIGLCLIVFPIFFLVLKNLILFSHNQFPLISLSLLIILIFCIVDFPFRNIAVFTMFVVLLTNFEIKSLFRRD